MKLYLSSYRIPTPEDLFNLVGKDPHDINVALIPNAKDYYAQRARAVKIRNVTDYLLSQSLRPTLVDLRKFSDPSVLAGQLAGYDMLWVMGGNTFCLRHEMRRSGFEKSLPLLMEQGTVYAGESAGAVVAGTSLAGIETADDPEFAESSIKEGLGIVPYFVLPHVDSEDFKEAVEIARQLYPDTDGRLEIKDSQAVVIENNQVTITEAPV